METVPLAMLLMSIGITNGESRPGPFCRSTVCCASSVARPPMPLPIMQPKRSGFATGAVMPASSIASRAAPTASCVNRSARRTSLGTLKNFTGSNPRTSPAILQSNAAVSNCVIGPMPLTPFVMLLQKVWMSFPTGVRTPIPVMTTRRCWLIRLLSKGRALSARRRCVANGKCPRAKMLLFHKRQEPAAALRRPAPSSNPQQDAGTMTNTAPHRLIGKSVRTAARRSRSCASRGRFARRCFRAPRGTARRARAKNRSR